MADSGLYGTQRWKKIRAWQIIQEPLCRLCKQVGRVTPASVADHITPHKGDEEAFWNGELQSLCKTCHSAHKQRQEKSGSLRGCDVNGMPLDPAHHWRSSQR